MSATLSRTLERTANSDRVGGIWPTEEQLRLLRVALSQKPDEAAAALAAWKPQLQIDQLDLGSQRLLSLCYLNLQRNGIDDPLLAQLEEFYNRARDRNRMIFTGVADLLRKLHDAGIQAMLFKGASMVTIYDGDDGARYMDDCDMLIPTRQAALTIATMNKLGWQTEKWMPRELTEEYFNTRHAAGFTADKRLYVDIHWHTLVERYWPGADDAFWETARPMRWNDAPTYRFDPADSLLISCVHGTHWNPFPAIRWVTDAVTILRKVELNWERFVQQTERLYFARPVYAALSYLRDEFGMAIPEDVLRRIGAMKLPGWAVREYEMRSRPIKVWSDPGKMWLHHVRGQPDRSLLGHVRDFPRTLTYLWYLNDIGEMPTRMTQRLARRVLAKLGGGPRKAAKADDDD